MAQAIRVEVYGLKELVRGSRKLVDEIDEEAGDRFEGVADKVASATRTQIPRRSGALAASVSSEKASVGIGGPDVPYAGWIEFGGRREGRGGGVASRPYIGRGRYLYPTAFSAEPMLVNAGEDAARDEIKEMRWPKPRRW
jgi:hypothetical protein